MPHATDPAPGAHPAVIAASLGAEHAADPRWEPIGDPTGGSRLHLRHGDGAAIGAHVEADRAVEELLRLYRVQGPSVG